MVCEVGRRFDKEAFVNWDQLTENEKMKATHYLDGLEIVLGHELDTDELRRHWNNLTEDEQAEILEA